MTHTAPPPEPDVRPVPLSRLALAPENVRKTPADPAALAELKASIAAHGLLENLIVRAEGPGPDGIDRFAVVAGGRRLAALEALAADGVLDADHPVPCLIAAGGETGELSLAENVVRVAMHPADQVSAFAKLAEAGITVAAIAARFGVSERTVEQRLRLGNAAPELLDAYRAGGIDLDALKAFATTADRARQIAVWTQVGEQGYRPSPWQVRRLLTEDRVPATAAVARFVGVDAYEAAGGIVDRDLFADEDEHGVWLGDPGLLNRLAMDRLEAAAEELRTRWKWAEAQLDLEWNAAARFGRIHPQPAEPTDEEEAEAERLRTRHDELADLDDEDWTEELVAEAEGLEARLDEIDRAVEARATFRREDLSVAGCIVTVGDDGALQVVQGLIRPEDVPARSAGKANGSGAAGPAGVRNGGEDGGTARFDAPAMSAPAARPDPEAEARKEAGVGIGLSDDLRAIRTALVKAHLACDFEAAFDLALFQMGRAAFAGGYRGEALDIAVRETPDRPPLRANDDGFADASPGEAMLADRSRLSLDWMEKDDDGEAFAALRDLPQAEKRSLFAACVARTVKGQLAFEPGARPELEATVARLDIEFAAHVRPTADLFWSRVRKDRLLAVARDTLGAAWASAHGKSKKADLAAAMEAAFAAGDGVPAGVAPEGRAAALSWTPPGFRAFDRGRVDDGAGEEPAPAARPEDSANGQASAAGDGASGAGSDDTGVEPAPVDGPRPVSAVESIDSPAVAERLAAARAAPASNTGNGGMPAGERESDGAEDRAANGNGSDGGVEAGTPDAGDVPAGSDLAREIDALNAVACADGGPRIVVRTEGFDADRPGGNGRDSLPRTGSGDDLMEIPAFLRRS